MKPLDWQKTLRHDRTHLIGETSTCLFVYGNEVTGFLDTTKPYDMVIPIRFLAPGREKDLEDIIVRETKRNGKILVSEGEPEGGVNIKTLRQKMHFALSKCRPEGYLYELTKEEREMIDRLFLKTAELVPKKAAYLANQTNLHLFIHEDMKSLDVYDENVPLEQAVYVGFEGQINNYIVFPASEIKARKAGDSERDIFRLMVLEEISHAADLQPDFDGAAIHASSSISRRLVQDDALRLNQWVQFVQNFSKPMDFNARKKKDEFVKFVDKAFASDRFERFKAESIREFGSTDRLYEDTMWQILEEWNAALNIFDGQQYQAINSGMFSIDPKARAKAEVEFKTEIYAKTATIFGIFYDGKNEKDLKELFEFMFPPAQQRTRGGLETNSTGSQVQMNELIDSYYDGRYSEAQKLQADRYIESISRALKEEERKPVDLIVIKQKPQSFFR